MNQNTSTKGYPPSDYFMWIPKKNVTLGLSVEDIFYVIESKEASSANIYGLSWKSEHLRWKTGNPVSCSQSCIFVRVFLPVRPVPEFIDPVFTKTSPKRSFSLKGTQDWDFFWLRFRNLYYFFNSYVKILRFYQKNFWIRPLLGEIRIFRLVWD